MSEEKVEMKICSKCRVPKEEKDFSRQVDLIGGLKYQCKSCDSIYAKPIYARDSEQVRIRTREWERKNPEAARIFKKRAHLKHVYGISLEEHSKMLSAQVGKCAICQENMVRICVDHCHKTDQIRGLLCDHCNVGLGRFKDSPENLRAAAAYLEKSLDKSPKSDI